MPFFISKRDCVLDCAAALFHEQCIDDVFSILLKKESLNWDPMNNVKVGNCELNVWIGISRYDNVL